MPLRASCVALLFLCDKHLFLACEAFMISPVQYLYIPSRITMGKRLFCSVLPNRFNPSSILFHRLMLIFSQRLFSIPRLSFPRRPFFSISVRMSSIVWVIRKAVCSWGTSMLPLGVKLTAHVTHRVNPADWELRWDLG